MQKAIKLKDNLGKKIEDKTLIKFRDTLESLFFVAGANIVFIGSMNATEQYGEEIGFWIAAYGFFPLMTGLNIGTGVAEYNSYKEPTVRLQDHYKPDNILVRALNKNRTYELVGKKDNYRYL